MGCLMCVRDFAQGYLDLQAEEVWDQPASWATDFSGCGQRFCAYIIARLDILRLYL